MWAWSIRAIAAKPSQGYTNAYVYHPNRNYGEHWYDRYTSNGDGQDSGFGASFVAAWYVTMRPTRGESMAYGHR